MKLVSIPSPAISLNPSVSTTGSAGSPGLLLQSIPMAFPGAASPDMACRSCAHADRRLPSSMLSSSPLFVMAAPPSFTMHRTGRGVAGLRCSVAASAMGSGGRRKKFEGGHTCARPQPTSTADRDAALNQSNLAPGNGGEQWPAEIRRDLELASGAEEEKPEGGEPGEGRDGPAG